MTDDTRMTYGIYKGTRMKDVPAAYLLSLSREVTSGGLKEYVSDNYEILTLEANRDGRLQSKKRMERR